MGRPPLFNPINVPQPNPTEFANIMRELKVGDIVELKFVMNREEIVRSPSSYGLRDTPICNDKFIVININHDNPIFEAIGLRGIMFKNIHFNNDMYISTWVITTDGHIREIETYGI